MVTHLENCNKKSINPNKDNKSGHRNICYHNKSKKWRFSKMVNGHTHEKLLKSLDEAIEYKKNYLNKL